MTKRNQKTIYWPPGREEALRRIAIRENLRAPGGEYSISAAIGWLIARDEKWAATAEEIKEQVAAICKQYGIEDYDK